MYPRILKQVADDRGYLHIEPSLHKIRELTAQHSLQHPPPEAKLEQLFADARLLVRNDDYPPRAHHPCHFPERASGIAEVVETSYAQEMVERGVAKGQHLSLTVEQTHLARFVSIVALGELSHRDVVAIDLTARRKESDVSAIPNPDLQQSGPREVGEVLHDLAPALLFASHDEPEDLLPDPEPDPPIAVIEIGRDSVAPATWCSHVQYGAADRVYATTYSAPNI